jgi:hypothetical protein
MTMNNLGSHFPQAKAQQNLGSHFTMESGSQLQLYMIFRCHDINNISYTTGTDRMEPALNG